MTWALLCQYVPVTTSPRDPSADPAVPSPPPRPNLSAPEPPGRGRRILGVIGGLLVLVLVAALVLVIRNLDGGDDKDKGKSDQSKGTSASSATSAGAPGPLIVMAHQGGFETYPHETLIALVNAVKSGAAAETDVQFTSDGVAVLVHDNKTTAASKADAENPMVCEGGPYTVSTTSWKVLHSKCRTLPSASKDGKSYGIPTFDETMKAIAAVPGAQIFAELKVEHQSPKEIAEYLSTVTKYGMADRVIVSSFFPDALADMQAAATKQKLTLRYLRMLRGSASQPLPTPDSLSGQGLWGVALRSDLVTPENVAGLHAKQLKVVDWTVNVPAVWKTARKAGIDYMLTDRPDAYRAFIK